MAKNVKGILIDANNRTVTAVELEDSLDGMYKAIGCELITSALVIENDDTLYVDDEGMFSAENFFTFEGGHQPFAGNGVILGCGATGESCHATVTLESVKARVKFYTRAEAAELARKMEG